MGLPVTETTLAWLVFTSMAKQAGFREWTLVDIIAGPTPALPVVGNLVSLKRLAAVLAVAELAGRAIMAIYSDESRWRVVTKSDASPLTAADIAAHNAIAEALRALPWPELAQAPLLSEESDAAAIAARHTWPVFWLVDPLDGTREFLARNGEFSVNIALVVGDEAVLGVVHSPVSGVSYVAAQGLNAYRVDVETRNELMLAAVLPPKNWRVIHVASLPLGTERPVCLTVSRRHGLAELSHFEAAVVREFGAVSSVSAGSAFKICAVAEGSADAYPRFGPTSEWDTAAAQVVLEMAGGVLCDSQGRRFRYNVRKTLLNGSFLALGQAPARWLACWPKAMT